MDIQSAYMKSRTWLHEGQKTNSKYHSMTQTISKFLINKSAEVSKILLVKERDSKSKSKACHKRETT